MFSSYCGLKWVNFEVSVHKRGLFHSYMRQPLCNYPFAGIIFET